MTNYFFLILTITGMATQLPSCQETKIPLRCGESYVDSYFLGAFHNGNSKDPIKLTLRRHPSEDKYIVYCEKKINGKPTFFRDIIVLSWVGGHRIASFPTKIGFAGNTYTLGIVTKTSNGGFRVTPIAEIFNDVSLRGSEICNYIENRGSVPVYTSSIEIFNRLR